MSKLMEVIDPPAGGDAAWDAFCEASPEAWFWHSSNWRDYTLAYRPDANSRSRAFYIADGSAVVAAVPLMVEHNAEGRPELSFGAGNCWAPALAPDLDGRKRADVLRTALAHVDAVATAEGAVRCSFRLSPLVPGFGRASLSFLAETSRAGYADISATSAVIDLRQSEETLLAQMTKGHRSDIRRAVRSVTVEVFDSASITTSAFEEYRSLHQRAAGRVTRPPATFELMRQWVTQGCGLLLTGRAAQDPVSCAYLTIGKSGAYYASAANEPGLREPAGHLVQWTAIQWLQANGYEHYELGAQQFGPLPHEVPSVKELNIARFKRGFGGELVPVPVREKWFDPDAYRKAATERASSYVSALGVPT